jgi:indolepyruvate ferredoxin oxidoreductase beta subunit
MNNDVRTIVLAGVGGQGTILVSRVLTTALIDAGYDVKMSEIHGMAQRGGSVSTTVRYGKKVESPLVGKGAADILVAFEQMEAVRTTPSLKKTASSSSMTTRSCLCPSHRGRLHIRTITSKNSQKLFT